MTPSSNSITNTQNVESESNEHMPPEKYQRRTHEDDVSIARSHSRRHLVSAATLLGLNRKGTQGGMGYRERPLPPLPQPTACASTASTSLPARQEMVEDSNEMDVQPPGEEGQTPPSLPQPATRASTPSLPTPQEMSEESNGMDIEVLGVERQTLPPPSRLTTHAHIRFSTAQQEMVEESIEMDVQAPGAEGQKLPEMLPSSGPPQNLQPQTYGGHLPLVHAVPTKSAKQVQNQLPDGSYRLSAPSETGGSSIDGPYYSPQLQPQHGSLGTPMKQQSHDIANTCSSFVQLPNNIFVPSNDTNRHNEGRYPVRKLPRGQGVSSRNSLASIDSGHTQLTQTTPRFSHAEPTLNSSNRSRADLPIPPSAQNNNSYQHQGVNFVDATAPWQLAQAYLVQSQDRTPSSETVKKRKVPNLPTNQQGHAQQYSMNNQFPQSWAGSQVNIEGPSRSTSSQQQMYSKSLPNDPFSSQISQSRNDPTQPPELSAWFIEQQRQMYLNMRSGQDTSAFTSRQPTHSYPVQGLVSASRHDTQIIKEGYPISSRGTMPPLNPGPSYTPRRQPHDSSQNNRHSQTQKNQPSVQPHPSQPNHDMYLAPAENGDESGPSHTKNTRKDKGKNKANDRHRNHYQGPDEQPTPPPFTMDTGDFMDHWTGMFNNVFATMQQSMTAQQAALQLYEARMDAKLDTLVDNLSRTKKPRKGAFQGRKNQDEGTDADDESNNEDTPHERDHEVVRLQDYVRAHLKALLNLQALNKSHLSELLPPLTEQENAWFDNGHENAPDPPTIASGHFRIDFSRGMRKCNYNAVAKREFIQHFLDAVCHGSYTEKGTIPTRLRTEKAVGKCLETTVKYIRGIFKHHGITYNPQRNAQGMRRDTLALSRRRACSHRRGDLIRHIMPGGIFQPPGRVKPMKRELMSGDETDSPGPPKVYRILRPEWQSDALAAFFWRLDEIDREHWREPVATRATSGNVPRLRVHSTKPRVPTKAPHGLWRNCYHPAFLAKLRPWQIRDLEIIDEDYDFSVNPADQ